MNCQAPMFIGSSCTHTHVVRVRVALERLADLLGRQRVELLDPHDRDVGVPSDSRWAIRS